MMKIVVYRGFGTTTNILSNFVGQHEGKVVDLLENSQYNVRYVHPVIEDDLTRREF